MISRRAITAGLIAAPAILGSKGRAEAQLRTEAQKARAFGKFAVAAVLESLARVLPCAPRMRASIQPSSVS